MLALVLVILHVLYWARRTRASAASGGSSGGRVARARHLDPRLGRLRALRRELRLLQQDLRLAGRRRRLPALAVDHEHRGAARASSSTPRPSARASSMPACTAPRRSSSSPSATRRRASSARAPRRYAGRVPGAGGADDAAPGRPAARASSRRAEDELDSPPSAPPTPPASRCSCSRAASNVVVADDGLPGHGRARSRRAACRRDGDAVRGRRRASRGTRSSPLRRATGSPGIECLSGIPGSVGATPIQNVGAYGQEVAETIAAVRVFDRHGGAVLEIPAAECGFATARARSSARPARWVVLAVTFALDRAAGLAADPLRRAGARARGRRGRARAARRRARGGARAAPREGDGDRPRRPGLGLGRLVLHQPGARRRRVRGARGARPRAAGATSRGCRASPQPDGQREDVGRVADRARRLRARLRRPGDDRDLRRSTRSR